MYQMLYVGFNFSQNGYFYFNLYIKIIGFGLSPVSEINYIIDCCLFVCLSDLTLRSVPASLS